MGTRPTIVPVTAQKIIGSIVCTPPKPRVGESVLVEVKAPESGEISFACGMDMYKGKVVVQ